MSGCAVAPQRPIAFAAPSGTTQAEKVGIAMTALPKVDTSLPGAGCLLCMAAASLANEKLTSYAHSLPAEGLPHLKNDVADLLRKQGVNVVVIDEPLVVDKLPKATAKGDDIPRKDYSSLRTKYSIDHLIVIDIQQIGFERTYADYFPTSDPKGAVTGVGYEVNLGTNTYEWYSPLSIRISTDGKWDEPPMFPGLTNAYYQALETSKDDLLKPFRG
nr:hypothetical protein [Dyella soli]